MTNEEIIATFMESKPDYHLCFWECSKLGWWIRGVNTVHPTPLTLDRLHEVESRLTKPEWMRYWSLLEIVGDLGNHYKIRMIHATAAQKIEALANVLRETRNL
jgi:hypothetical protein